MDDFADEKEIAVGENFPCGVGEIDGAFDAVAKSELLGQADGDIAELGRAAGGAQLVDHRAVVMLLDGGLHGFHDLRGSEVDAFGRGGGHGKRY